MEIYGFVLITRDEAKNMGLPQASGMFEELYNLMLLETRGGNKGNLRFGEALNMTRFEKEISFLNRYFVFKKISEVDSEKVMNNFLNKSFTEAYNEENRDQEQDQESGLRELENQQEFKKMKPRVRKIGKKIKLVQSTTDEQEEQKSEPEQEPIIILNTNPSKKTAVKKKPRKLVIQEE